MSRPRGDHAGRREAIALAAADVIAARGLERVTLRDIAAALGVTTGVLTHYFPSKEALIGFTKELTFDRRYARAREAARGANGVERIHAVVAEMLPVDAERRTSWRLLIAFHGRAVGSLAMRRAHDRRMRRWFALFEEVVQPLASTGDLLPEADPQRLGMAIALFVEGFAIHLAMMEPAPGAEWQREFAREQVMRLVPSPRSVRPAPRKPSRQRASRTALRA